MMFIHEESFQSAFTTMLNKLIFSRIILLRPYYNALRVAGSDENLQRIMSLKERIQKNADRKCELKKAVIDDTEAGIIVSIFNGYISGLSMKAAAANAGVPMQHSTVKRILMRDIYTGTDFYLAIISRETFAKATGRRLHRANLHGCEKRYTAPPIQKAFDLAGAETHFDDPAEQAEYIYSLIEVKT